MFKALLLQTWYKLSDYGLEEALDDRISFRRFVGLGAGETTPDHSTFSIFRDKLREKKLLEQIGDILLKREHLLMRPLLKQQ
jgi:IS5 family transposase